MSITHTTVAVTADDGSEVGTDAWNEAHTIGSAVDFGDYTHKFDVINESTAAAGVTIEGVLLKDSAINFGDEDLDTYDDGIWTPTLGFNTAGDESWSITGAHGYYIKAGRLVTVHAHIYGSVTHTTASGNLYLSNLPFTCANLDSTAQTGSVAFSGITSATMKSLALVFTDNGASARFYITKSASAIGVVSAVDIPTGVSFDVYCGGTYLATS